MIKIIQPLEIKKFIEATFLQFSHITMRSLLLGFIFFFLISFFCLIIIIILIKIIKSAREQYDCKFSDQCREIIYLLIDGKADLSEVETKLQIADDHHKRNLLIDEIMILHRTKSHSNKIILRQLYKNLELDKISIKKVYNINWHIKVRGFHELSEMRIKKANKQILQYTSSKNKILRIEAELSSIRLLPFVPFAFLDSIERNFSLWEQINVYELIKQRDIEIPEFSLWLNSPNPWVVNYSLNMIRVLKQQSALPHIIELYKNSNNQEVRLSCLQALKVMNEPKISLLLLERYDSETFENQKEMIPILSTEPLPEVLVLLEKIACQKDFALRKLACLSLYSIDTKGKEKLMMMQNNADPELYRIIQQLFSLHKAA